MKKIVLLLMSFILITSCVNDKSDKNKDDAGNEILAIEQASFFTLSGDDKIDLSLEDIKKMWDERFLEEENKKVDLVEFKLIKTFDTLENRNYYFLQAKDKNGLISTGEFLEKDSRSLTFKINGK